MDGDLSTSIPSLLQEPLYISVKPGLTITELLKATGAPDFILTRTIVTLNGSVVNDWDHVMTMDGDMVGIFAVPAGGNGGGKAILSSIAMIAISIFAPYVAAGLTGFGFSSAGVLAAKAAGSLGFYALTAGITLVGAMLVSALIPPPALANAGSDSRSPIAEGQVFRITGQSNEAKLYGTIPRIFGRHRFFPYLAATPLVDNVGKTSQITALYDFGIGDLSISDVRVGNVGIGFLDPNMRILENTMGKDLELVTKSVAYDQFSFQLEQNVPLVLQTKAGSSRATLDLYFPQGLVSFDRNGDRSLHSVGFVVEWREQGSTDAWVTVPSADFVGAKTDPQAWIFTSKFEGSLTEPPKFAWYEFSYPRDEETYYGFQVIETVNGVTRVIAEARRRGSEILQNSITVNGRPYRRGVARESGQPGWSGVRGLSAVLSELLVPSAPPGRSVIVSESTGQPFTVSVRMNFPAPAVYEVRTTRTTPVNIGETSSNSLRDQAYAVLLKSHRAGKVLNLKRPHSMIELSFVANDKVNGVVDNLNAIAWSRLRSCTASGWGPIRESCNPAHIALEILTGKASRKPLLDSQIDFPSFYRLAQKCDQIITQVVGGVTFTSARFEWNGVIESNMTTQEAVSTVLGVARAQLTFTASGKVGVLIDEEKTQRRQMITPANSWNFEGVRTFTPLPDAFRVSFLDEGNDWQPTEVMVYRDGFSELTAESIEDLRTYGITSFPEAFRYGRYMMAQGIMRNEIFHVNMDVENLAVQRGDLVAVQHDIPRFGGMAFRIQEVNGDEIVLDRPIELYAGRYTVRTSLGTIRQGAIVRQVDAYTFALDDTSNLAPDDLIALGTGASVTRDYIVQAIEPDVELAARLTLAPYVPGVYTADTGPLPPWDPGFGEQLGGATDLSVDVTEVTSSWVYINRIPHLRITVRWDISNVGVYNSSTLQVRILDDLERTVTTSQAVTGQYTYDVPYNTPQYFNTPVVYTVTPLSVLGITGAGDSIQTTFAAYAGRPLPPRNVLLDVRSQEVTMFWDLPDSPDVVRYVIRYTPEILAPDWLSSQHLARLPWDATKFSTGARTGTYMILSEDVAGNVSDVVTVRTTVEKLPDVNVVEEVLESLTWPGDIFNMTRGYAPPTVGISIRRVSGQLVPVTLPPGVTLPTVRLLDGSSVVVGGGFGVSSEYLVSDVVGGPSSNDLAVYVFEEVVDVGDVYEIRISNLMKFGAIDTDNNEFIADKDDAWNAWLEYRAITEVSMISTWPSLSELGDMSLGLSPWGPWRKVNVGDATGRAFQFRAVAQAFQKGIQVVFFEGHLVIDMPDRQWRSNDIEVPAEGGVEVLFDPPFRAKPILAVNIEGSTTAVRYVAEDHDNLKVRIRLYDGENQEVSGRIDVAALGYGRQRSVAI
jgi:hypothetical protein